MKNANCSEFLEWAGPWMEGERSSEAEAHLRLCSYCRAVIADLGEISSVARSLAAEEAPARVWPSLRAQMEKEGLIRRPRGNWLAGWLPAVPRPALAGAYLALMIVGGLFLMSQHRRMTNRAGWMDTMDTTTSHFNSALDAAAEKSLPGAGSSNPAVAAELHKNLAIVDKYIALCEKSVREEPQSEMARDYLYNAYQKKAELVAVMADPGENPR